MNGLMGASYASLLGLLIAAVPLVLAVMFLFQPSEGRLALLRPATLAGIFAALCSFVLALTNGASAAARLDALNVEGVRHVAVVMQEGLAPVAASFALLTVAWGCATIGMRRG